MKLFSDSSGTEYDLEAAFLDVVKNADSDRDISVSSITFRANVHRNTFYYHFKNIRELIFRTIHDTLEKCDRDPKEFLPEYFHRNRKLIAFSRKTLGTDSFLDLMQSELIPVLDKYYGDRLAGDRDLLIRFFASEILAAYLLQDDLEATMGLIFDRIIPGFIF